MSFKGAFQWYHSHADPIWPDGTFKYTAVLQYLENGSYCNMGDFYSQRVYEAKKIRNIEYNSGRNLCLLKVTYSGFQRHCTVLLCCPPPPFSLNIQLYMRPVLWIRNDFVGSGSYFSVGSYLDRAWIFSNILNISFTLVFLSSLWFRLTRYKL